jgi:ferredoxin/flavodoxin---NADP+ reductase
MSAAKHWVAVIGGATAGAEVAAFLADRDINVVVIDQHARPYGKIEDGLPRWHEALRHKEYHHIDEKLDRPNVSFVPLTKVGRDLDFTDLAQAWGFSAVVLACGAWKDRLLPIANAETYVGRGLHYQNPFVIAFNHAGEPGYAPVPVEDGAIVLGGGLAAIDVAKILMLETTRLQLAERGKSVSIVDLEHKGIPATLAALGMVWNDLQLHGCTIVYRRQAQDMPLVDVHGTGTPEQIEKMHRTRLKLLHHAQEKFLFHLQELASPERIVAKDDQLAGMIFRRQLMQGGKLVPTEETFTLPTKQVVSAIGSVPEPIKGIPLNGELFHFSDLHLGTIPGFPNVFSVGNVVTGRGNIAASRKHARELSESAVSAFLGLSNERSDETAVGSALAEGVRSQANLVATAVSQQVLGDPPEAANNLGQRIAELQARAGYTNGYRDWMNKHTPVKG